MAGWAEFHVTLRVMFWVVPSLILAIACSCLLFSITSDIVAGMMLNPTTTAGVTVRFAEPVTDPALALMVDAPTAFAITAPAALTLAIAEDELHVADWVRFRVVPLEKLPIAASCVDSPAGNEYWAGLTVILSNAAAPTVTDALPVIPW